MVPPIIDDEPLKNSMTWKVQWVKPLTPGIGEWGTSNNEFVRIEGRRDCEGNRFFETSRHYLAEYWGDTGKKFNPLNSRTL